MSGDVSIVGLLTRQAQARGEQQAFTFLSERGATSGTLCFAALDRRARTLAARLLDCMRPGDRAVLFFNPGLDMVVALFGCLVAGVIAVPLMLPRRGGGRDFSAAVLDDCTPRLALSSRDVLATRQDLVERYAHLAWLEVDAMAEEKVTGHALSSPGRSDIAFLQYTSGSTSTPKGVVVTHGSLLANLEMIRLAMGHTERSTTVGWVPLYHDMGMVMQVMAPLYAGAPSVLMSPASLMQRPLSWLQAISSHRAELTCAPNFAFDLCVDRFSADGMMGVDLSCLKVALNGAEPVQAATLRRFMETFGPYGFDPAAMYPGYGLAEATLLVSGAQRGAGADMLAISRAALLEGRLTPPTDGADSRMLVACGRALAEERIAVVDPATRKRVPLGQIGEIWASGPHVTQGYWQKPEATRDEFDARIVGEEDRPAWLRTGDLGALDAGGLLYVTGRIKDLVIIRGANHYPQDIERTAQAAHPALKRDGGAAFSVVEDGTERLVLVHEVERTMRHALETEGIAAAIRAAVVAGHEIAVHEVALIRPSSLPRTTSGKVQRGLAKRLWVEGALEPLR